MKVGMGWLGWTEQQTLETDMQSIEAAYRGRFEMLRSLAGHDIASAAFETTEVKKTMSAGLFVAMFGGGK
jgi:hypothetical protein